MLPNNESSTRMHAQPGIAAAYQRTRLKANAVLLRYGHIIPIVAVAFCLILSTSISVQREIAYSRAAERNTTTINTTTTTVSPATFNTTSTMPARDTPALET
ncbi:hypothetical protein GH5_01299 [Leishmania sp. Ghana 2012 LV757]|uniref:hypothetical protein n=1 Tax=Leishmania sp. Ghana 2012 LV757 TaxID=2803181 RepID=UPI001B5C0E81|nr:hypothetical protein GH5_01299 [Leishmania sp. Ghana 2012 LV757]